LADAIRQRALVSNVTTTEGGPPIFDSVSSSPLDDCFATGTIPGSGTYFCLGCGSQLSMEETDELPDCPSCGDRRFRRDSIFASMQEHPTTNEFPVPVEDGPPDWLMEAKETLTVRGHHLAWRDEDGEIVSFTIERGWTRIGRSPTADLQLDDPSVSRRHALIVAEPGRGLRVLDDRSLNGVLVNGEEVEWGRLKDGDELMIGRYRLYALTN
jgi:DNA-directed RNA polymerase subunit RPC12/RpoP